MLVLTRKPGERIQIGENVWVEVRRIAGNRVTLAIEAPRDVHILRGELERFVGEFAEDSPPRGAEPYHVEHYRVPRERTSTSGRLKTASA